MLTVCRCICVCVCLFCSFWFLIKQHRRTHKHMLQLHHTQKYLCISYTYWYTIEICIINILSWRSRCCAVWSLYCLWLCKGNERILKILQLCNCILHVCQWLGEWVSERVCVLWTIQFFGLLCYAVFLCIWALYTIVRLSQHVHCTWASLTTSSVRCCCCVFFSLLSLIYVFCLSFLHAFEVEKFTIISNNCKHQHK